MEETIKLIIQILLILYVTIIALNPSIKNPYWILLIHENPWLLLIIVLLSYYIMQWDLKIGLLLLIICIGVYLDIILIIKKEEND